MGETEVTARCLPSTQLAIENAGGDGAGKKETQLQDERDANPQVPQRARGRESRLASGGSGCVGLGGKRRPRLPEAGKDR